MNKKTIFEKSFVIEILSSIYGGINTAQKLSECLKKKHPVILEQLGYIKNDNLIYQSSKEKKQFNEKEYRVNTEQILKKFFEHHLKNKNFNIYKDNDVLTLTMSAIIFAKQQNPEIKKITLNNIFEEMYQLLLKLCENREKIQEFYNHFIKLEDSHKKDFEKFLEKLNKDFKNKLLSTQKDISSFEKIKNAPSRI